MSNLRKSMYAMQQSEGTNHTVDLWTTDLQQKWKMLLRLAPVAMMKLLLWMEQGAGETGNVVYNAVIVLKNGDEVDLGDFGTKDDAYNATKQYCSEQVNLGNMTQQEADELLETMSQQWDGWSGIVNR